MKIPAHCETELAAFPAGLRQLVEAELAAGNGIAELGHGFPAAPCGAYILLERAVTTRPRAASGELHFHDRIGNSYSGEFTDAVRHFFVLEPPHPPPPEPDMDAIRADLQRRCDKEDARREAKRLQAAREAQQVVGRFQESMEMNFDRWHDGTGADLELLKGASPAALAEVEDFLASRRVQDWRDVEALAALASARAKSLLRAAFAGGEDRVRLAVLSYAPELLSESECTEFLVRILEDGAIESMLPQALLVIEDFHPPEVIRAMLHGLMRRDGGTACHLAAMLYFLHGKAAEPFDWKLRPHFLQFNTADLTEREAAVRILCETLGLEITDRAPG
jgi:hypothetical protein